MFLTWVFLVQFQLIKVWVIGDIRKCNRPNIWHFYVKKVLERSSGTVTKDKVKIYAVIQYAYVLSILFISEVSKQPSEPHLACWCILSGTGHVYERVHHATQKWHFILFNITYILHTYVSQSLPHVNWLTGTNKYESSGGIAVENRQNKCPTIKADQ